METAAPNGQSRAAGELGLHQVADQDRTAAAEQVRRQIGSQARDKY